VIDGGVARTVWFARVDLGAGGELSSSSSALFTAANSP
jgi:hypothetical protein